MTVNLEWYIPEQVLLMRISGRVILNEIAAIIPDLQRKIEHLEKVDILHDLTLMEQIHLQWWRLPKLILELRQLKVGRAIYVRKIQRPSLEGLAKLMGKLFGISVYLLESMSDVNTLLA